ncbi:type IV pilus modification PilV family protein [Acidithiobacillus ferrooxidans]|uniref:type IV pilus modification PilV family protein n=1 Tax=Acidithiobacillus ferrooxidans TaxID=920 RepID=UPI0013D53B83|nr:prepilin-type N-terminal cleavage/methylation domain-containing protein [Acidithiobacillus ferrooxidans]
MIRKYAGDEAGLSLVEAMVSMAILSIAALGIGGILTMSFQQTNSAENVLNSQTYGMATAVGGTYSTTADVINNVNISTSATASASSIPDAVMASASSSTSTTISVTTAPVTSGTNLPSWWLP